MADFEGARDQLRRTRSSIERAVDALAAARTGARRIRASAAALDRAFAGRNPRDVEARARLNRDAQAADAEVKRHVDELTALRLDEAEVLQDFSRFTDPRAAVARMSDDTPILLMPVRVETRFKAFDVSGAAPIHQLWVRIY